MMTRAGEPVLHAVGEWTGWPLPDGAADRLDRLHDWLLTEAVPAGALGPNEVERIRSRHLADSLAFAGGWAAPRSPTTLVDLGSGVGLPGLPLAVLWPQTRVWLVERSGRRAHLARRAVRMLELPAVRVVEADAATVSLPAVEMVVARAVSEWAVVRDWAMRLLVPGGCVVVGASRQAPPNPLPAGEAGEVIEVPAEILDRPVWLRKMAAP